MAKQTVPLYTVTSGDRVSKARDSLADALGGAQLGDPDDAGGFEVSVDAESPEAARDLVREAFARAGTGDDFVIREGTEGREMPADDPRQADDEASPTTEVGATDEPAAVGGEGDAGRAAPAAAEGAPGGVEAGGGEEAAAAAAGGDEGEPSSGDRASLVADAASAVAAAASSARAGDTDAAREAATAAAEAARTAAGEAAEAVREAASSARQAVDEKGIGGAASDYASAAQGRDWSRFAPIGAGLLLLIALRRMRRR
jgi:hypothetical protein